jgi:hypothetical protein
VVNPNGTLLLFSQSFPVVLYLLIPSKNKRAVNRLARQNKSTNMIPEVRIASVVKPYKSDPVISFSLRYQASSSSSFPGVSVTRAMILNTMFMNLSSSTSNGRIFQAVRVSKITLTTSISASIQWRSLYAPSSTTLVTGTSTTAAGVYISRPPKNSLASFWSTSGSSESEILFTIDFTANDYVDVSFQAVFQDDLAPNGPLTAASGSVAQVYRSRLDGPATGALLVPVLVASLN